MQVVAEVYQTDIGKSSWRSTGYYHEQIISQSTTCGTVHGWITGTIKQEITSEWPEKKISSQGSGRVQSMKIARLLTNLQKYRSPFSQMTSTIVLLEYQMNSCFSIRKTPLAWLQMSREKAHLLVAITELPLPIYLCLSNLEWRFHNILSSPLCHTSKDLFF